MQLSGPQLLPLIRAALAAVLAVIPGVVRWWRGRRLSPDDPALPERLVALRPTNAVVTATAFLTVVAVAGRHAIWAVPLLLLGYVTAAYPLRRRLLGETWSLPAFLAWTARLVVAIWGFWLLLLLTPTIVWAADGWRTPVTIGLVVLLYAWHRHYPRALLALLGAHPMAEPAWPAAFGRVLDGSRLHSRPGLWRAGPHGARVANAIALPSLRGSHVLFSETLLECLDDEERTAVLAHEVSHLELFTRSLLVRWQWGTIAVIASAAAVLPVSERLPAEWRWVLTVAWPLVVLVTLTSRGRVIRAQEEPSDRRAVELSGNPEAVVSGLVKLHETAKLPRRWALAHEQQATHPSLARRIRAIRAAAGRPAPAVPFPVILRGTGGEALVLEADRVRYLTGAPAAGTVDELLAGAASTVAVTWADVGELRVEARGNRPPRLVLADVRGTRWTVPLEPAAVAGVQSALDTVDERLPAAVPAGAGRARMVRASLVVLCALLVLAFQWSSALLVAFLAILVPSPAAVLASAVASIAAGLLAAAYGVSTVRIVLAIVAAAGGAWVASLAWRWRRAGGPDDRIVHPIVGLSAVIAWTAVVLYGWMDAFALHLAARAVPALVVLPLATAAAWAWAREPRFRRGVMVPLLLGAIGVAVSTTAWLDLVVRDPLRAAGAGMPVTPVTLTAVDRAEVDASAAQLWLSPSGRTFATAPDPVDDEDEESVPLEFTIGRFHGPRYTIRALAIQVPDDEEVVTLEPAGEQLAVRTRPVTAPATPTWSVIVSRNGWGTLAVEPGGRKWRWAHMEAAGVRTYSGLLGSPEVVERFAGGRDPRGYTQWLTTDEAPLGISFDYRQRGTLGLMLREFLQLPWRMPLTLRFADRAELHSRYDGTCYEGGPAQPVACVARDGARSHLWTWDGRSFRAAGWLSGEFVVQGRSASGWLSGWRHGRLTLVDAVASRALEIDGACRRGECLTPVSIAGGILGGLSTRAGRVAVATYRVEPATRPSP